MPTEGVVRRESHETVEQKSPWLGIDREGEAPAEAPSIPPHETVGAACSTL
jgi:hypothetical protein